MYWCLEKWDQVTTEAAIAYTRLLLKHWETVLRISTDNINKIKQRINDQGANPEEWMKIKETIEKVRQQTQEDLEKKQDRRTFRTSSRTSISQEPQTSNTFYQTQLPQRQRIEDS